MKLLPVLITAIFLLQPVTVETTDERRFKILKFGQTENDYVMFQHDMSQFETGFTVCSWVKKLKSDGIPTWFSYAVSYQKYEIQLTDMGERTKILMKQNFNETKFNVYTAINQYYIVNRNTPTASIHKID